MAIPYRFAVFFISRRKWPEMSECHNGDLLSRTTASYEMCNLARKWCLQNNPHTLRVRFKMDMVFYIFKVSHNHALFRFSLSSESDNPCWVLLEECKPTTIHTGVRQVLCPAPAKPLILLEFLPPTTLTFILFFTLQLPNEFFPLFVTILDAEDSMIKAKQIMSPILWSHDTLFHRKNLKVNGEHLR